MARDWCLVLLSMISMLKYTEKYIHNAIDIDPLPATNVKIPTLEKSRKIGVTFFCVGWLKQRN